MTSRREFLQTGVTVSALPLAINILTPSSSPAAIAADVDDGRARVTLGKAVFDGRYAEGRAFHETLAALGVAGEALRDGDVTDIYLALDDQWRTQPIAVAGLTQFGPMLVLERFGRERGLRLALRVEHRVQHDGSLAHVLTGAPETLALAETLHGQGVEWPVLVAAAAAVCRSGCTTPVERTIVTARSRPELSPAPPAPHAEAPESVIHYYRPLGTQEGRAIPWDGPLFSWVIAPPAHA